ncbi:MAG: iron-sulfur cluster assembly protein [Planctomycetaceae bacterium]
MTDWTPLATTGDLQPGDRRTTFVDDEPVLLVRIGDDYLCVADACTHDGQPLGDGPIDGIEITCSRHGARFNLTSGEALCMPATEAILTYEVQVRDGQVLARPAEINDNRAATEEAEQIGGEVSAEPAEAARPASEETGPPDSDATSDDEAADAVEMIESLREVIDPELLINIVDLGLIYDIRPEHDKVTVDMTLTSPACPAGPQLVQQAKLALEKLDGVETAEINLVMTPPWTPERMTDDARDKLGIF